MTGNLVDAEGFPRADIDVFAVRTKRQRFAVLKTDYKAVSAEIEKLLHVALARTDDQTQEQGSSSNTAEQQAEEAKVVSAPDGPVSTSDMQISETNSTDASPNTVSQRPQRHAFALVDMVSNNSPAASAGLRVGDRIFSFGAISLRSFATPQLTMAALPGLLREHENQPVVVEVERRTNPDALDDLRLTLIPTTWAGRGLLGCHIVPIEVSQVDERYAPEVATAAARRARPSNV